MTVALLEHATLPFELAIRDAEPEFQAAFRTADAVEVFTHAVWLHFRRLPKLQACTTESIKAALTQLAISGLDITQPGEVWLIPHDNRKQIDGKWQSLTECVMWDGYLGRIKLARQHPDVADIVWDTVRELDTYTFNGKFALPAHAYPPNFGERGRVIGAYAAAHLTQGTVKCVSMSKAEVLAHRDQYSRGGEGDVWNEYQTKGRGEQKTVTTQENRGFGIMVAKVVISQLCHPRNLPMTRVASAILAQQDRVLAGLKTLTPADVSTVQQPVQARPAALTELFPDAPQETALKTALLGRIGTEFVEQVALLLTTNAARQALCTYCFGCADWTDLQHLSLTRLQQGLPHWTACLAQITAGIPEAAEAWEVRGWVEWLAGVQMAAAAAGPAEMAPPLVAPQSPARPPGPAPRGSVDDRATLLNRCLTLATKGKGMTTQQYNDEVRRYWHGRTPSECSLAELHEIAHWLDTGILPFTETETEAEPAPADTSQGEILF